jgi:hypothetical protein
MDEKYAPYFKPVFAVVITLLCFMFFFFKGVDNGIMVLVTVAIKHYFDSTASSVQKSDTINKLTDVVNNQQKNAQ